MTATAISQTIAGRLRERAQLAPDDTALVCEEVSFTWKELDARVDELAVACLSQGIKSGERVAIWIENRPEWIILFYALARIGASSVLLNTCSSATELSWTLASMEPQYLFYGKQCKGVAFSDIVQKLDKKEFPKLKWCCALDDAMKFMIPVDHAAREALKKVEDAVKPSSTASILLTSGTTSGPKGVMLTHANMVGNAQAIVDRLGWSSTDRMCIAVPLFHCFGVTVSVLGCACSGATMVLVPGSFHSETVLRYLQKFRCTLFNGVPTMFLVLLRYPELNKYDLSALRGGIIAGSWLRHQDYMRICEALGMDELYTSYGLSESAPCVTLAEPLDTLVERATSSGPALDAAELRIWDVANEKEVPSGQTGEIQTRSAYVMKGYYGKPDITAQTITHDGWLKTGDTGYIDENNRLHVNGRIKEMILRGGECISPIEIEQCIAGLDGVKEVKVVGVYAEVVQEEIVACVVREAGSSLTEEDVKIWSKEHLAKFKVPRHVLFFNEFPMGASGKIRIGELKMQAQQLIKK